MCRPAVEIGVTTEVDVGDEGDVVAYNGKVLNMCTDVTERENTHGTRKTL